MTPFLKTVVCVSVIALFALSAAKAETVTIADNYIGNGGTGSYAGKDVIGNNFQTNSMTVSYSNDTGLWNISIDSLYFKHLGEASTQMGDLFLSTNGWNPSGQAPYKTDNMNNGEGWEYAFVLSNHLAKSGTIALYAIDSADIISSTDIFGNSSGYRKYQEVQVKTSSAGTALASGTYNINGQVMTLAIDTKDILTSYTDFGFHWTQTCGNDVIEGGMKVAPGTEAVPEPSTMALLGFALLGALHYRRRFVD